MDNSMIKRSRAAVSSALRKTLGRWGYEIHRIHSPSSGPEYEEVRPTATYAPWNQDPLFLETYKTILPYTLVDMHRCYELWALVEQTQKLTGGIIEVGVWRGGTGGLVARKAKLCGIPNPVYLCDTFTGVVKAGPEDLYYQGGEHANASKRIVEELIYHRLGLDNARIIEGVFPDQTAHLIEEREFRLCHIDVDVYQSAEDIMRWIWERMVVGGIVVYDDYGFEHCNGIVKHVEQQRHHLDRLVIHNLNGHAVVVKIG